MIGVSHPNYEYELYIYNRISYLFPDRDAKILDIGIGAGKYGKLLGSLSSQMDGIEAFEDTIKLNPGLDKIYDNIFIKDAIDFEDYANYDVVVFGDVLEHMMVNDAQNLLSRIYDKVKEIIVVVPFLYEQDIINNNPYEIHYQSDLTHEIFLQRYPFLQCWAHNQFQGLYMKGTAKPDRGPALHKNKVAVYTIAKNEEANVNRFMDSVLEADYVVILDTGSTDNTVNLLRDRGAIVATKQIVPWRFDTARNESLKMVPDDATICISLDLDEVMVTGWALTLKNIWRNSYGILRYFYVSSHLTNGAMGEAFFRDKIHPNNYEKYHWKNIVHEVLTREEKQTQFAIKEIICHQFQDQTKDRKSYVPLIRQQIIEEPNDLRSLYLLGRELMVNAEHEEAIEVLSDFIVKAEPGKWEDFKANAFFLIGRAYFNLKEFDEAIVAYRKSIEVGPYFRMAMLDLANVYMLQGRFYEALQQVYAALQLKERYMGFSDDPASWAEKPYVLAFWCLYNAKMYEEAEVCYNEVKSQNIRYPQLELMKSLLKDK